MTARARLKGAQGQALAVVEDHDDDKEQEQEDDQAQGKGEEDARSEDGRLQSPNDPAFVAAFLRDAIGSHRLAGVFLRSGELVHTPRIGEDGYIEPKDPGVDLGPAQVRPFTPGQLKTLAEVSYCFGHTNKNGEFRETLAPASAVAHAHEAARMGLTENVRPLNGVTHTPAMRPDGTVLDQPGYDRSTGLLYLPDRGLELPPVPDNPTAAELEQARDELLALVDQVPWVSADNQATWLGLAMTPALRALLPPPYPLGLFTAPNPGSGKSRLAAIIRELHGGVLRGQLPENEELRKQITATLVDTTAPVVVWDNLTGVVRSPVLEALLTTDVWSDRYLGYSRDVAAANDRLWLATGNNATIGGDLGRRVLVVEIDHKRPDPHLRMDFRIVDLAQYLHEHRGRLLASILTMARAWHVAGQERDDDRGDNYRIWAGSLRAMLAMAKVPGRFGGETSTIASKVDPETKEWADFLREIHRVKGVDHWLVRDLVGDLAEHKPGNPEQWKLDHVDAGTLPGDLAHKWAQVRDGNTTGFSRSLGLWLRNRAGRYAEGWKVEQASSDVHGNAYRAVPCEE
jgi:hypothetical protein